MVTKTPIMRFVAAARRAFAEIRPQGHYPHTMQRYPADNMRQIRTMTKAAAMYVALFNDFIAANTNCNRFVPGMALMFGWPLAAREVLLRTGI
jgi:hypothetical protein